MNVLESKTLNTDLNFMYNVFKFDIFEPKLVGTGSLASQLYAADFDFLNIIDKKYTPKEAYEQFKKVFNNIKKSSNLFFIEFKIQEIKKNDKDEPIKTKIFKMEDLNLDLFIKNYKNIDLCKIDCIIYLKNGMFKEVSCIFFFNAEPLNINKYRDVLLDDQKYYYNLKKYYKSLKRIMVASKYSPNIDNNFIILISSLFNSGVGKLYELDNEIQAAIIYLDKFGPDARIKMFIHDIGLFNMNPNKLKDVSDDYNKLINREALNFYKKYKIPIGKLPKFDTIKL